MWALFVLQLHSPTYNYEVSLPNVTRVIKYSRLPPPPPPFSPLVFMCAHGGERLGTRLHTLYEPQDNKPSHINDDWVWGVRTNTICLPHSHKHLRHTVVNWCTCAGLSDPTTTACFPLQSLVVILRRSCPALLVMSGVPSPVIFLLVRKVK